MQNSVLLFNDIKMDKLDYIIIALTFKDFLNYYQINIIQGYDKAFK